MLTVSSSVKVHRIEEHEGRNFGRFPQVQNPSRLHEYNRDSATTEPLRSARDPRPLR